MPRIEQNAHPLPFFRFSLFRCVYSILGIKKRKQLRGMQQLPLNHRTTMPAIYNTARRNTLLQNFPESPAAVILFIYSIFCCSLN